MYKIVIIIVEICTYMSFSFLENGSATLFLFLYKVIIFDGKVILTFGTVMQAILHSKNLNLKLNNLIHFVKLNAFCSWRKTKSFPLLGDKKVRVLQKFVCGSDLGTDGSSGYLYCLSFFVFDYNILQAKVDGICQLVL